MASLLGPPEPNKPKETPTTRRSADDTASDSDSFMKLMNSRFNTTSLSSSTPRSRNNSGADGSSGNPSVDFFFNVVPGTHSESLRGMLHDAWVHDPLTTLKLIFNLRGVRGTGKSDKQGFFAAAIWLHELHPMSLACNVPAFAEFGCFKDLPEVLYRVLEGSDVRERRKRDWKSMKRSSNRGGGGMRGGRRGRRRGGYNVGVDTRGPFERNKQSGKKGKQKPAVTREIRVRNAEKRSKMEKQKARIGRKEKKIAMAKKVVTRYTHDPEFRFLYDRVSDFFSACLKSDMDHLKDGELNNIGLAAKWCPSIDSAYDKATLLCEGIARKLFRREEYSEYQNVEETQYVYLIRDRLRKEVLVPLHKALELPEVYIGANNWASIPYDRVASVAMTTYKEKFLKHDPERFSKYLEDVKAGKAKIAAGAVLPHEIVKSLEDDDGGQVAELQWKRMVDDLLQKGKMKNCLAVCDVSDKMKGTPMEVCVSLGALVSELGEEPWKGKLITFSEKPTLETVEGDSLRDKTAFIRSLDCGDNTDFQKVFDIILKVAVNGKLKPEQMIKRVFVFTRMEFDQASDIAWETDYKVIVGKFTKMGFEKAIPELVFWNLKNKMATPVPGTQKGVALLSGSSKNLMKLFLQGDGAINPEIVMEQAIAGEEYQKLVVVD